MMARLVLLFNDQVIREYPFVKQSMTIGREAENDIQIDNLAVSGFHARIDKTGESFILTDLQSTNGTFVGDKKIVSHKLSHSEKINIGKHVILFLASEKEDGVLPGSEKEGGLDKTMILDTAKQRELLAKQESAAPRVAKPKKIGVLTFLDGSKEGEIELTKKLTRIGKAGNSEVKLSGLFMGATSATISKRPSGYAISFAGGMTKLKINGDVVKNSVQLNDFDTIELGSYRFQFYQKDLG
ncbi:MAG: FHA domain-containing protein [Thermodesulfobacteriota bacterium]|nr:FHA domain-containing protein [Thermodesulfobacteriota bacterium]